MEHSANGVCKIVQYDKNIHPRHLVWKGTTYSWDVTDEGFPVYALEKEHARIVLAAHPSRYHLYKSTPFDVQVPNPNGSLTWEKMLPMTTVTETVRVGYDEENSEILTEKRYKWIEDVNAYSYSEDGKKDTARAIQLENEQIEYLKEQTNTANQKVIRRNGKIEILEKQNKEIGTSFQLLLDKLEEKEGIVKKLASDLESLTIQVENDKQAGKPNQKGDQKKTGGK